MIRPFPTTRVLPHRLGLKRVLMKEQPRMHYSPMGNSTQRQETDGFLTNLQRLAIGAIPDTAAVGGNPAIDRKDERA